MATKRTIDAARTTFKQAQTASREKHTLIGRKRQGGETRHALEDRNRQQLYELAQTHGIAGRSTLERAH